MRIDVLIGRSAAMCAHPYAAWRASSAGGRLVVVLGYSAVAYALVFTALALRSVVTTP